MELIHSSREELLEKLQLVSNIVERKNTMQILANIWIQKKGLELTFLSSDIEIQISTQAYLGSQHQNFSTTVSARKFLDLLKSLPEQAHVVVTQEGQKLTLATNKSRFVLQTMPAEDFPLVKEPNEWSSKIELPQKILKHLLTSVSFSMAQQDLRYFLNGVLFVVDQTHVRAVATDSHRLAYADTQTPGTEGYHEIILPRKTVFELSRLLSDTDDLVSIELAVNQAKFSFGSVKMVTKLVEGKFPDYKRVVSVSHEYQVIIQREVLQKALQRASILTSDKFRGIRWLLDSNRLTIIANNSDQEEAKEEIELSYTGPRIDVGFNLNYLLDVLNAVKSENIQISLQDSNSSVLVTLPEKDSFRYVVMPMRI